MRFLVGQLSNGNQDNVLQIVKDGPAIPTPTDPIMSNGHYLVTTPPGIQIDTDGVIPPFPITNINTQKYSGILAQYPQFTSIPFNPLITVGDLADIDDTAPGHRAHMGTRGMLALPKLVNNSAGPQPGQITTAQITLGAPASEFMVYWEVQRVSCLHDSDLGPGVRVLFQEEASRFNVEISNDGGASYTPVPSPLSNVVITTNPADTRVRLRFTNWNNERYNLAAYAVLY